MTNENAVIIHDGNGSAMSAYQQRDDVRELGDRLMAMHPAAGEVGAAGMRAAAQLALMLGANPLPGVNEVHIWKQSGKVCMSLGINYWRRKASEWGGVLYQVQPRPMNQKEKAEYSIPDNAIAAICRGVRAAEMIQYRSMGFTTNEIWDMCGRTGIGTQAANEYAKNGRPNVWTSLKRAETDMLRQLFPAEFAQVDRQAMVNDAPIITVSPDGDLPELSSGEEGDNAPGVENGSYTIEDANADFFDAPPVAPARAVQSEPAPTTPTGRTYADGSPVAEAAVEAYDAYLKAHDDNAPKNVHNLRNWYKTHRNGNGNGGEVTQPALVADDPDAHQAAIDTAAGLFD